LCFRSRTVRFSETVTYELFYAKAATGFHMKNIKKTGWDGHPHPPSKSFSTKYPARMMVFIISSISIMLMGETQLGIFGFFSEPQALDSPRPSLAGDR